MELVSPQNSAISSVLAEPVPYLELFWVKPVKKHPVLAGIEIYNNGVKITTEKGASARAIFDGTVSRILNIPGAGKAIIVSHGDYFSVYSNLSDVYVTAGQSLKTKQEIGLVSTNPNTNETITELQIWKGNKKLNPAQWMYRAY